MASLMLSPKLFLSPPVIPEIRRRFCKISPFLEKARPTASRIHSRKMCRSNCALKLSPFPELDSHLAALYVTLNRTVISIGTFYMAPNNPELRGTHHVGAGVCIDPTLVLTSARVVGCVASDKIYIGSTSGRTAIGEIPVDLKPLAVSFANDVAVLKVVKRTNQAPLAVCHVAESPPAKESILMSISHVYEHGWGMSVANVRAVGKKTIPAKAPPPLDDEVGWIEHDWLVFNRGPVPPGCVLFDCKEKVCGTVTKMSGSPWFNLYGELVGVASWVLRDDAGGFSVGYAAPMYNIWPVVHYATTKGRHDPVVMDRWINGRAVGLDQKGRRR